MDPRHDPDLILGHLEGDLSSEDAAKVQALRAADPDFAALLDGMADDRNQLRAAPVAEPPAGLADGALADLERSMLLDDAGDGIAMLPPGRQRRFAIAPLLTYGGIAAVLALTASAVLKSVQPPASSPSIAAAPADDAFDIADATIEAQREMARRDRADVGFGADAAAGADTAAGTDAAGVRVDALVAESAAGDAAEAFAGLSAARTTKLESDDAPRQMKAAAAPSASVAQSAAGVDDFRDAVPEPPTALAEADAGTAASVTANRAVASAADRFDHAAVASRGEIAMGRSTRGFAANETLMLEEAVAAAPGSPPAAPDVAAPRPRPAANGGHAALAPASPRADAAPVVLTRATSVIVVEPAAPPAPPVWMRPVEKLGGDWTRWTTLAFNPTDAAPLP